MSRPEELARLATELVLADLATAERGVVVDSPPGAGKSTLVVRAAAELAAAGERVMIAGQTNEQVDDLVDRLAGSRPGLPVGRLSAHGYTPTARVSRHDNVRAETAVSDLADAAVVLATAAKWATVTEAAPWPWAVVDEAYQMRSDLLLRVAGLFEKALFVGDPGQLDPFSTVETERWTGLSWDPMSSAVAVLLNHNPQLPVHTLPVSWRLPASAAPVVSEAFYPFTGFTSATTREERRLGFATRPFGINALDRALETAAESGWALYELPARHTLRTDREAVAACAALAARLLQRGAIAYSEAAPAGAAVTGPRIAVGTAHRDQAAAVRGALASEYGVTGVVADTANSLQGREFDVVIVLHPLSGRRDATAFHLEAGRLCVLTSRHRHACIVVARAGIPELLDAHPSVEPVHLGVPAKFPDGWEANQAVMAHLAKWRVPAW
ncbi:AAA domain-containing protein [Trebonia sp.]|uniref:AAA domain-containing protein n=1 Tax=Trebonia sp. TaxID=2767075 RepID=UPI002621FB12|nr:AAA domain-containing protein [Trebonia sp.]